MLVGGNWYCSGTLVTTIPGSLKPDSRDPETETGDLEIEKRVHRIHGTLETGLQHDPSQPGGPHKVGRRILLTYGAKVRRCLNRMFWDPFCQVPDPRPENV